ncbi:hypothetical protein I5907_18465 [Panacibacter sp. DH6]|uniref:Lipocalin-like domain-containing protein n=1 Tax=Panacibacter microcysteis TaxID=2793269 RepID=A0A931GZI3_9BACT|nr:hypothetical protein [Panacibacter microcysteis]MBG9378229.1 hypothetical protein [Panacibacter microcysteis]
MKNLFAATILLVAFSATSCKKDGSKPATDFNTPSTAAPQGLTGNWASGFVSMTQLVDVYTGKYVGNAWQSGKFFKITADGKNAEFYYVAESAYMQSATKASGTIAFDEGSTATEGSFTFYAGWAHYNGWGTTTVNRDASADELQNNLTGKYYYKMEGEWLRINPGEPVNEYSSSFEQIN